MLAAVVEEIVSDPWKRKRRSQLRLPRMLPPRLLALDGTIEFFRDSVFNYPSFAEAYKVAALNGLNKL